MNRPIAAKLVHSMFLLSIAVVHVWAAFRFNRNAYSPVQSALEQIGLYLVPLLPIAVLAFSGRSYTKLFGTFYTLMTLMLVLTLSGQAQEAWTYLVLQLPVLWMGGMIAFSSLFAKKPQEPG
jgi:hypothetical protein